MISIRNIKLSHDEISIPQHLNDMRALFDCSSLFRNGRVESGIPTYAFSVFELLKRTGYEIIPFYSGLKTYDLEKVVGPFLHLPLPTHLIQVLTFCGMRFDWMIEKFALWNTVTNHTFDLFFTPNVSTFYRYFSPRIKVVGVVHDLTHVLFPELKPQNERWRYFAQLHMHVLERLMFWNHDRKPVIDRFHHLVAISEHTKRDLVEFMNVPEDRITMIYPTLTTSFFVKLFARIGEQEVEETLDKFSIRRPYVLFLGHLEPRKNVEGLIRAFFLLRNVKPGLQLVIVGREGYGFNKLMNLCKSLKMTFRRSKLQASNFMVQDVIFTGHISNDEKSLLMQSAEVFVYPSLYEGFAYPCFEAMSVGTPVVTSPVSALPEVLGNAALYADPWRPESIAAVVGAVLKDPELRARLVQKGRECMKTYQNTESSLHQWKELFKKFSGSSL